ncbi:hypothetical protein DCAR_0728249 [Daucus carota subsp. sativus]|uniref:HAT C-terminal dimerisation domain-containing protein n=1 Tax=Daucus carota subsp. sativus TaxID=79200 RepID=A0AAF0XIH5_DAUCS|nr:hypothetical protein DCAR_0728249 [Daucus carota subsp. sativus]
MISRATLKRDIFKIYDIEKLKMMRLMERIKGRISFTTDMWTSSNKKRGFMVIIAHFVNDSWRLEKRIIRFAYVPCPHTAEAVCDVLMDTFLEWNVDSKLSTLTVDNCTTNDAMINLLLDKFGGDQIWLKSFFHVRRTAHILNLIVKEGLEMVEKVKNNCCDLLTIYESKSKKRSEEESDITLRSHSTSSRSRGVSHSINDFEAFLDQEKKGKTYHVKSELDHYLEEEQLPRRSVEFDILSWWKTNGIKYPTLQAIARDVLAIPVSTVASESDFSTSG